MLAPGTILQNRYRIVRLINQGGMGAVYLAEDERLGNEIALKETFFASNDLALREQFHREARLLSRLHHTSLPRVIDHFIDGDGQFLVMDYIAGKDLKELLQENSGPFPVDKVLGWADQLLEILSYLHAQDQPVIHRDIKPANIKLTPQGKMILLDFGLAKGASSSLLMSLPAATVAYAPPEQVQAEGTDQRSDIFSLGVTLYQLMTNTLPPTALYRQGELSRGLPDPVRMASNVNAHISVSVAAVLARAMMLGRQQRFQSATAMREAFTHARNPITSPPTPIAADLPTKVFTFDTVTLDAKGNIINQRKGRAELEVEDLGGGVTLEMVKIVGGEFLMGSPEHEDVRREDEGPQHLVNISPFLMGKYPVTQLQWQSVARLPEHKQALNPAPSRFKGDNLPVEQVSWEEAIEFCARLSNSTGREYRLAREAEWEYACRAGTTSPFAFGETITTELVNYDGNYPYGSAPRGTYLGQTTPVGSFGYANGFGLYDMHGNVWEWCMDWYSPNYYAQNPSVDPTGPSTGSLRVLRGGGWNFSSQNLRAAVRGRNEPDVRLDGLGLRLIRADN